MSCHNSCSSCFTSLFDGCSTCPSVAILQNNACFCSSNWDPSCTYYSLLRSPFVSIDSFYTILFSFVILLYCLRVKLPLSYRIIVGLQGLSMLLFSNQFYLYFQSIFGLVTLSKSNGYYGLSNRLQGMSFYFVMPPLVLFCCFLVGLFTFYYPIKQFVKEHQSYGQYLRDNAYNFLTYFYYFASRRMWINSFSTALAGIIPFCIFALIIFGIICKSFYDFHNNKLDDPIYQPQIYLYTILSPLSIVGLPLVQNQNLYILIYLIPIGLLFLIMLLNKNYMIISKQKIIFYIVQVFMPGFAITFVIVPQAIKGMVLFIAIALSILVIIVQISVLYYSGINLQRSAKIYPENSDTYKKTQNITSKTITKSIIKKASYF